MKTETQIPDVRTAAALAVLDYHARGLRKLFRNHLRECLACGYVFSTPSVFLMGKAVLLGDGRTAWYIYYARGDVRQLAAMMPFPLPFVAFQRRGRQVVYETERFLAWVNRKSQIANRKS